MASRPNTARLDARRDSYPIASYATRGRAPKTRTQSSMRRPRVPDSSPLTSAIFRPWPAFDEGADLVGHLLLGLVPGDGLARGERPAIAIGMVQALERRLPCDAERPTRPREARIALELDDAAVAVLREHAASGGTLATGGREVRRDPGNDLFGRRHQREQLTRRAATTAGRRDGAGGGDDLEERPAVYLAPWPAHRLISFERSSSEG